MAPIVRDDSSLASESGLIVIASVIVSFTITFVALFGLCACCGKDAKKKTKKDDKVEPPKYLEMDVPGGGSKSTRSAEGSKKEKPVDEPKKGAPSYVELEPPPCVPFKSDTVVGAVPAASDKGASAKAGGEKTKKEASIMKQSVKGKETGSMRPGVSVVGKSMAGAKKNPTAAKGPDLQYVHEDDPRYRSLAQLDDVFEGTQLKAPSIQQDPTAASARTAIAPSARSKVK